LTDETETESHPLVDVRVLERRGFKPSRRIKAVQEFSAPPEFAFDDPRLRQALDKIYRDVRRFVRRELASKAEVTRVFEKLQGRNGSIVTMFSELHNAKRQWERLAPLEQAITAAAMIEGYRRERADKKYTKYVSQSGGLTVLGTLFDMTCRGEGLAEISPARQRGGQEKQALKKLARSLVKIWAEDLGRQVSDSTSNTSMRRFYELVFKSFDFRAVIEAQVMTELDYVRPTPRAEYQTIEEFSFADHRDAVLKSIRGAIKDWQRDHKVAA
jgi:hypothetical protein